MSVTEQEAAALQAIANFDPDQCDSILATRRRVEQNYSVPYSAVRELMAAHDALAEQLAHMQRLRRVDGHRLRHMIREVYAPPTKRARKVKKLSALILPGQLKQMGIGDLKKAEIFFRSIGALEEEEG